MKKQLFFYLGISLAPFCFAANDQQQPKEQEWSDALVSATLKKLPEGITNHYAGLAVAAVPMCLYLSAQPLTTERNKMNAASLDARSPEEFKECKRKELCIEALTIALRSLAPIGLGFATAQIMSEATKKEKVILGLLGGFAAGCAGLSVLNSVRTLCRLVKHLKQSDKLYALLQDPEFKKRFNVTYWEAIKDNRKHAESIAYNAAIISFIVPAIMAIVCAVGAFLKPAQNVNYAAIDLKGTVKHSYAADAACFGLLAMVLPPLVKPLVAALIRTKNNVAIGVDAAFDQCINNLPNA